MSLWSTVLDAIFPVPESESEVLRLTPAQAWSALPRARDFPTPEACSLFAYRDEHVWRLIWSLKYKKSRLAAATAAYGLYRVLVEYAQSAPFLKPIVVVPMPISRQRHRERGFNQCELIADELARIDGGISGDGILGGGNGGADNGGGRGGKFLLVAPELLIRARHKARQTMKDRSARLESAQGLFEVRSNKKSAKNNASDIPKDSLIIVIDDVITTGSTMRDAVFTLRRAGYAHTFGLSVAH